MTSLKMFLVSKRISWGVYRLHCLQSLKSGSAKRKQKLEIKEKKKKLPKIDTFLTKKSDVA
jgi:hypothetical protein